MTYKIIYEKGHSSADTSVLYAGLADHARKTADMPSVEPFSYLIRDNNNTLQGGCLGAICYCVGKDMVKN